MADETIKLAAALEHILKNYEGDEDDPKWKEAKEALDNLPPREMQLRCPNCKILHVDEGEWRTKPHKQHMCKFCGTRFEPCSFPTYGKGLEGMDAKEGTAYLDFVDNWLTQNGYPGGDDAMTADIRYQMAIGWRAARDYWSVEFRKFMEKNAGKRVRKKSGKKAPRRATLQVSESEPEDSNSQIAEEEGISF